MQGPCMGVLFSKLIFGSSMQGPCIGTLIWWHQMQGPCVGVFFLEGPMQGPCIGVLLSELNFGSSMQAPCIGMVFGVVSCKVFALVFCIRLSLWRQLQRHLAIVRAALGPTC